QQEGGRKARVDDRDAEEREPLRDVAAEHAVRGGSGDERAAEDEGGAAAADAPAALELLQDPGGEVDRREGGSEHEHRERSVAVVSRLEDERDELRQARGNRSREQRAP